MASKYKLYGKMIINGKNKRIFRIEKSVKNYVIYNKKYIELQKYKKIIIDKFKKNKGGMSQEELLKHMKEKGFKIHEVIPSKNILYNTKKSPSINRNKNQDEYSRINNYDNDAVFVTGN